MILEEIKKANIIALKEKDHNARTIYSIVTNKAMLETIKKREKNEESTDNDMIQIIQKNLKLKTTNKQKQIKQLKMTKHL